MRCFARRAERNPPSAPPGGAARPSPGTGAGGFASARGVECRCVASSRIVRPHATPRVSGSPRPLGGAGSPAGPCAISRGKPMITCATGRAFGISQATGSSTSAIRFRSPPSGRRAPPATPTNGDFAGSYGADRRPPEQPGSTPRPGASIPSPPRRLPGPAGSSNRDAMADETVWPRGLISITDVPPSPVRRPAASTHG